MLAGLTLVFVMAGGPPKWMKVFQVAGIQLGREKLTSVERRLGQGAPLPRPLPEFISGNASGAPPPTFVDSHETLLMWAIPKDKAWRLKATARQIFAGKEKEDLGVDGVTFLRPDHTRSLPTARLRDRGFWTHSVLDLHRSALKAKLQALGLVIKEAGGRDIVVAEDHGYTYYLAVEFDAKSRISLIDMMSIKG